MRARYTLTDIRIAQNLMLAELVRSYRWYILQALGKPKIAHYVALIAFVAIALAIGSWANGLDDRMGWEWLPQKLSTGK